MSAGAKRTIGRLKEWLGQNWQAALVSLLIALFLWFWVTVKNKVAFQTEVPLTAPEGTEVFPDRVLVSGRISEKFFKERYLNCFKAYPEWDGRSRYAPVRIEAPLPPPFVEIDAVYPGSVEVRKTQASGFSTTSPSGSTSSKTNP